MKQAGVDVDNIALIATPVVTDYEPNAYNADEIRGRIFNIFTFNDIVQFMGGSWLTNLFNGTDNRQREGAINIDATSLTPDTGGVGSHTSMHNSSSVLEAVPTGQGN